jgi:hypothetical protein
LRALVVVAALAGSLFALLGAAPPASAYFRPMPTPTGPHHHHRETNPSRAALARMTPKQRHAVARSGHATGRHGRAHCVRRCVNPALAYHSGVQAGPVRPATDPTSGIWCRWIEGWVWTENVTGAKVWQFKVHTDFCWNAATGRVVSHKTTVHPTVYTWASALGWQYRGTTEVSAWRPFGDDTAVRTYAQGHFDFCPPRIWCVQTKYPYVYLDVYGTGWVQMSKWGW